MHGFLLSASSKISRTRDAPTPTYISTNCEPVADINDTPASPAVAFANRVFPVPGGPSNNTPEGTFAPASLYRRGCFKKSTTSVNSYFASSHPATSSNVISEPEDVDSFTDSSRLCFMYSFTNLLKRFIRFI